MKKVSILFRKLLSYLISPFTLGLAVTLSMTYLSVVYYSNQRSISRNDHTWISLLQQIHEKTIDWRLTYRGQQPGSDRVAILAIDEKAIEQEGRWPWPRDKQAHLVEKAIELGAKSVSFDIVYSEEDQNSSMASLRRLRRGLASKSELNDDLSTMIEGEIRQTDGDSEFSRAIGRKSDQLILGSYFDPSEKHAAYQEFCHDALFERSSEARYWKKEQLPLTVTDVPLSKIAFPKAFKDQLTDYFTQLEVLSSQEWFEANKDLTPSITENLEDFAAALPPETYPGLATLWLNNDIENAKAVVQPVLPQIANNQGVRVLFSRFGAAFTKKQQASLAAEVRGAGSRYCERFFTDHDELLSLDKYKVKYGDSKDSIEQFQTQSWASLWPKIQSSPESHAAESADTRTPASHTPETLVAAIARIKAMSLINVIPSVERWWVNTPLLGDPTKHTGFFNAQLDTDGTIRRSSLVVRIGNSYMPSLALKTFLVDKGLRAAAHIDVEDSAHDTTGSKVLKSLDIVDQEGDAVMRVPVDQEGHLMINYAGGAHMFPHISAADVLSDAPDLIVEQQIRDESTGKWSSRGRKISKKEFLKDKLLIFGATAIGVYDLRVTPFDENYPGVETHANVLSNLLIEHARAVGDSRLPASAPGFLRTSPREEHLMWPLLIMLGITLSALLSYFGSVSGLGITAIFVGGIFAIDRFWLFRNGIVTAMIFPMTEVVGTYVTLTFYKYFTEERKKRELKGTFEKYVSPAIVNEILSNPENIELGGKKMELTVMFSDIRGFTNISEKLDPRELSDFLNSYLTPMTALVFKNKGTLDKYMGDAIMAFWGAPIHFKDHPIHAARCALQMLEKLKELQARYRAQGLPPLDIGIGLNTGDMSVGNMGSETVRSYTVMGDSVNLGSRLEGLNKNYGTRIIISEFTLAAVKDKFVTREIDWVRVKGKEKPVRIFELIAEGKPTPEQQSFLEAFARGFKLYHERCFQEAIEEFKRALALNPNDTVACELYIEHCREYLGEPPPENWDGVANMKTK